MAEYLNGEGIAFDATELENFVERKDSIVISQLRSGAIALMPKVAETVRELARRGYVMGISSGACRQFIDEFIERFGFSKIMRASTSANEVVRKKPHPDVFLATFEKLSSQFDGPDAKYVVGDGWSDVQGGHAALARTVWFNYLGKPVRDPSICDFEMRSFDELLGILP
jgi:beta-phosphoglucomutase-like phosphatase (HAD superfamily)